MTTARAIVWDEQPGPLTGVSSWLGYGAEDRIYTVEEAGSRWRWVLPETTPGGGYASGAHLTAAEAKKHAEDHERKRVDDMGKKAKKDKGGAAANGANGAAHKSEAELRGHERPGGVERARFVEQLPCKLDAAEVEALEHKLTGVTREKVRKENEKAVLSEEIKGLKKREDSLVEQLDAEAEDRDVECVEMLYVETGAVDTVRLDSGEVIRTRTATAEDLQEDLDGAIAKRAIDEALGKPLGGKPGDTEAPDGPVGDGGGDGDDLFDGDQPTAEG